MPQDTPHQSEAVPDAEALDGEGPIDHAARLRARATKQPFHVVLLEPEIPPNTGNVARLCAATGSVLHLIHPLGFQIDEKAVRRAGLDYWHLVRVVEHDSWNSFAGELPQGARSFFFTGKARRSFLSVKYEPGDFLIFGRESSGLPDWLLNQNRESLVGIPTLGNVRSLNLANAATLGIYEALRQTGQLSDSRLEPLTVSSE